MLGRERHRARAVGGIAHGERGGEASPAAAARASSAGASSAIAVAPVVERENWSPVSPIRPSSTPFCSATCAAGAGGERRRRRRRHRRRVAVDGADERVHGRLAHLLAVRAVAVEHDEQHHCSAEPASGKRSQPRVLVDLVRRRAACRSARRRGTRTCRGRARRRRATRPSRRSPRALAHTEFARSLPPRALARSTAATRRRPTGDQSDLRFAERVVKQRRRRLRRRHLRARAGRARRGVAAYLQDGAVALALRLRRQQAADDHDLDEAGDPPVVSASHGGELAGLSQAMCFGDKPWFGEAVHIRKAAPPRTARFCGGARRNPLSHQYVQTHQFAYCILPYKSTHTTRTLLLHERRQPLGARPAEPFRLLALPQHARRPPLRRERPRAADLEGHRLRRRRRRPPTSRGARRRGAPTRRRRGRRSPTPPPPAPTAARAPPWTRLTYRSRRGGTPFPPAHSAARRRRARGTSRRAAPARRRGRARRR